LPAAKSNLLTNVRSWRFRDPPAYWGRRTRQGRKKQIGDPIERDEGKKITVVFLLKVNRKSTNLH
jgi:hypothetical protein